MGSRRVTWAAIFGLALAGAAGVAEFTSENELGTATMLLVGGAFLVLAVFRLVPTKLAVGERSCGTVLQDFATP